MPCTHPASALKPDSAEQSSGKVTLKFCCTACLAPITKQFMLATPEPTLPVEPEIADLLEMAPPIAPPAELQQQPKRRGRGHNNSPWHRFTGVQPTGVTS